jgi:hypothetical protein
VISVPAIFRALSQNHSRPPLFQFVLKIIRTILKIPIQDATLGVYFPSIVEVLRNTELEDAQLFRDIAQVFIDPQNRDADFPDMVIKITLQLLPLLAKHLFYQNNLPIVFQFRHLEMISQTKELLPYFQKAVQGIALECGLDIPRLVTRELSKFFKLKVEKLSEPMDCPFATIAKWVWEVNQKELGLMKSLLSAFEPVTDQQFIWTMKSVVMPIHPLVNQFLRDLVQSKFSHLASDTDCPLIQVLFLRQAGDLLKSCWNLDWFAIDSTIHLDIFLCFIVPASIAALLKHAKKAELMELASLAISSISDKSFSSWKEWYCHFFPCSSLSECFWAAADFVNKLPIPRQSIFSNQSWLDVRNFCEDSLGL